MSNYKFVKNEAHFINYINSSLRNAISPYEMDQVRNLNLLTADEYIEKIYKTGLADKYTWSIKNNLACLDKNVVDEWVCINKKDTSQISSTFQSIKAQSVPFSDSFFDMCYLLENIPGVYSFWNGDVCRYVGKSKSLGARVVTSYCDKYHAFQKLPIEVSTISATNSDAGILELYFIHHLQPDLNKKDKDEDEMTINLDRVPAFGTRVLVLKEAHNG